MGTIKKTSFLKTHGSKRQLFQSLLESVHRFSGGFIKAVGTPALEQRLQQEGPGKSVKILKHFARVERILMN
jgi:hypothetical protein